MCIEQLSWTDGTAFEIDEGLHTMNVRLDGTLEEICFHISLKPKPPVKLHLSGCDKMSGERHAVCMYQPLSAKGNLDMATIGTVQATFAFDCKFSAFYCISFSIGHSY